MGRKRVARRGLEDVFDYLVPPEEQRAALEGAASPAPAVVTAGPPVRWCLPAEPDRLLACALAVELAAGLVRAGRPAGVIATFARPRLAPRAEGVEWETVTPGDTGPGAALATSLDARPGADAIVAAPPGELPGVLRELGARRVEGLLLAVDARPAGLRSALGQLRRISPARELRIGAVLLGTADADAESAFRVVDGAARRQLGRALEPLGALCADATSYRALLQGRPAVELDRESPASRQLLALCGKLRSRSARPATGAETTGAQTP